MEVDVLLAWDGKSIASCGVVAPVLHYSDHALVHSVAKAADPRAALGSSNLSSKQTMDLLAGKAAAPPPMSNAPKK